MFDGSRDAVSRIEPLVRLLAPAADTGWLHCAPPGAGCSALKQKYRDRLAAGLERVRWVHLKGSFELIESRLQARRGHYLPPALLRSQFAVLEEPADAIVADVSPPAEEIAARLAARLTAVQPL